VIRTPTHPIAIDGIRVTHAEYRVLMEYATKAGLSVTEAVEELIALQLIDIRRDMEEPFPIGDPSTEVEYEH
jgi:hypothetical protein